MKLSDIRDKLTAHQHDGKWSEAYQLLCTVTPNSGGQEAELVQYKAITLLKAADQHRRAGFSEQAAEAVNKAFDQVFSYLPRADICSQLSVPTLFDAVAANLISHNADTQFLNRLQSASKLDRLVPELKRMAAASDSSVQNAVAEDRPALCSLPFGACFLLASFIFRCGWVAASYDVKAIVAQIILKQRLTKKARHSALQYLSSSARKTPKPPLLVWGNDRYFRASVREATIALVGPGHSDLDQGKEIDSFDIVVRTNPIEIEALNSSSTMAGSRTDIAYYNGRMLKLRREDALAAAADLGLKFACVRKHSDAERFQTVLGPSKSRVYALDDSVFLGRGYALHHCLFDILRYRPGRVKIFNADFFLGKRTHYDNYLDTKLNLVHSYAVHDVMQTWTYLKTLFEDNMVEGDPVMSDILSLSREQFIERVAHRLRSSKSKELRI